MNVIYEPGQHVPIKTWTDGVELEDEARAQLINTAKMPFLFKHLAVMPDVHWGMGSTIGSVIATKGAVIPAAVGVDLGCGMIAQRTMLSASMLPDDLGDLRSRLEVAIPHGRTNDGRVGDRGAWGNIPSYVEQRFADLVPFLPDCAMDDRHLTQSASQLGTLGTGNHFVEVCLDEEQRVWVMLHSGSRGIGNSLASVYIAKAKATAAKYFYESYLPDKDLAFLPEGTPDFDEYVAAVEWAQTYAHVNREIMMRAALNALAKSIHWTDPGDDPDGGDIVDDGTDAAPIKAVNCHHNYLARERHFGQNVLITRKGAVSAQEGEYGIIPGSMGAKSFIVRGLGNRESFMSCSHGAGRRMSRGAAKRTITLDAFKESMAGIESRTDVDVLDEAPAAYKSIEAVMAAQSDLVEVVHTLKQVCVVKG